MSCAFAATTPGAAASPSSPAFGLLIKLKSGATSTAGRELPQQVTRERLARVFQGKSLAMGSVRPIDEQAQLVSWARPLQRAEADRLAAELRQDPDVEWVEPNVRERRMQAAPAPNDPYYSGVAVGEQTVSQWWLSASPQTARSRGVPNIANAWRIATGGPVSVAILDTGLLRNHPDLQGARFETGYDLMTNEDGKSGDGDGPDPDFSDTGDGVAANECESGSVEEASSWHGSRIAGQIGALTDNGSGVAGMNWGARIVSVRIAGKCGALVSDIIQGMRWAAGLSVKGAPANPWPARIVNLSFGGSERNCAPYQDTIDELVRRGVLVVAAGGNEYGSVSRPARCPGVLGVGAVNRNGFKATYSNLGPQIGITTVGGDPEDGQRGPEAFDGGIYTVFNSGTAAPGTNTYGPAIGTSFSTPIVSGVASLMLSVNDQLTLDQLVHGIKATSRPHVTTSQLAAPELAVCDPSLQQGRCLCTTSTCGAGLLDAEAALQYARDPSAYPAAPVFHTPGAGDENDDGGGGGALDWGWLAALTAAAGWAARVRRRTA
ncbi:S8 family peptidase [Aquabacterium sp. A7-Y]|uniref:S8 family peptidase n=1 Tax=Aquabacterium sp. A7-Y TaxID=1349605 RepID=UPI00223C965E|nr:S8 family peptidase [Aquabacterium sp. A7-Y]MCW7536671.1 S8 family peptidase [Aquabacterium sp. A7-Y]